MIDFEVLKKKCQELPELKTLEAAQKKEEGILAKMQSARADIAALEKAIVDKDSASIAALIDDQDNVGNIRRECEKLKIKLADAVYWLAKIETTALPQVRKELASAERAYKAGVKNLVLESAKEVAADVVGAVVSLYKMYLCWNEGLKNLSGSTGIGFPEHEFTIRIESELRERLGRKQCAGAQPFFDHVSKELQRATVLWNQMGIPKKKAIPEEPAETEQTVGENDVFIKAK
jgi:hypothetical protein